MRKLIATFLLSMTCLTSQALPENQFDSFVLFGDSLSDNGNLYDYMWGYLPISPPYYQGHFTNGKVWAEYLYQDWYGEQNAGGFQDYAVGGAGAVISRKGNLPFSLAIEIDDYFYWNKYDKPESSLFVVWIGANNYLNGPTNVDAITSSAVNAIGSSVERLIKSGGKKFLIANLPDISVSPFAQKYGDNLALLLELVNVHNQKLDEKIAGLKNKYPDIKIIFLDIYRLFNEAIASPEKYRLTNTADPCYLGTYSGWYNTVQTSPDLVYSDLKNSSAKFDDSRWQMIKDNPQLMSAAQFGQIYHQQPMPALADPVTCFGHLFWDHIHPTTEVHRAIADEVKQLIKDAGLVAVMPEKEKANRRPFHPYGLIGHH